MLYAMGVIGGIGYAVESKAYVIAVAVGMLGYMALPMAKNWWKELNK